MTKIMTHRSTKPLLLIAVLACGVTFLLNAKMTTRANRINISPEVVPQQDLTGTWKGDDGATYQVRHVGKQLFWYGQSPDGGKSYTNVFHGVQNASGEFVGSWADVPPGQNMGNDAMTILVVSAGGSAELRKKTQTGGSFGASVWRRPPSVCTIWGMIRDNKREYKTRIFLYLVGGQQPQTSITIDGPQYTQYRFNNVPEGTYELRANIPPNAPGPGGLGIHADDNPPIIKCERDGKYQLNFSVGSD